MLTAQAQGHFLFIMIYSILIDQRFAVANELKIVQAATLAACMTLPMRTNTISIDGNVWYEYSEKQMIDDFPLLFTNAKSVYRNLRFLIDGGFIATCSFERTKYMRFTPKCKTWNNSEADY